MSSSFLVWSLTFVKCCQSSTSEIRAIWFCFRSACSVLSLLCILPVAFSFLGHCNVAQRFLAIVHHIGHFVQSGRGKQFNRNVILGGLLNATPDPAGFCFLCIFSFVHMVLLTTPNCSSQIIILYSHVALLFMSSLLNTAWNILVVYTV